MNLVQDHRLLEQERENARKQMSRYVGISADDYSRGGHSGSSGPSSYSSSNMTGFGNPNFNSQGQADSRPSYESNYSRGYDSNPKFESRESREAPPAPKVQLGFFEQTRTTLPEPQKAAVNEPPKTAKPLAPPNLFEPPKATQQPVRSVAQERSAAPVDIFAPPAVTKQTTTQAKFTPQNEVFFPPAPPQPLVTAMPAFTTPAPVFASPSPSFTSPPQQLFAAPGPAFSSPQVAPTPVIFASPAPVFTSPPATFTPPLPVNFQSASPSVTVLPQYTAPSKPANYPSVPPTLVTPQPYSQVQPPQTKSAPQPDSRFRIHHNMDAYSGPTIGELKATPSLKEDFTEFHTAPGEQGKSQSADVASMLVNLDDLRVEPKKKDDPRHNIGF